MLNQSRGGIVPQLVNQYNEIIEQNLCQIISLNEFRDNQSKRFDETIVLSDQNVDTIEPTKNYPDINGKYDLQSLCCAIRKECYQILHQTNDQVLVKNSQTLSLLKNNLVIKNDAQNKKNCHSCDNKDPEVIKCQPIKELIPIEINPVLEYLIKRRKHSYVTKTIVPKEICGICSEPLKFSEKYIQCMDCLAISHMVCTSQMPVPCIKYTNPNLRPTKQISNYVYPAFRPSIPALLIHCIREVEQRCHETSPNSLYVMNSENMKQVKDLSNAIIKTKNCFPLLKNFNINIICGVIKKFLSDFNESLIGREIWKQFSFNMMSNPWVYVFGERSMFNCVFLRKRPNSTNKTMLQDATFLAKKTDQELQVMLKPLIKDLDVTNRDTLSFLILHLKHLADNQKHICLDHLIQVFCPIICGDTEVPRKSRLMSVLFQLNREFWTNFLM